MNKKNINIGIIWANPYNKNMGVAALAYSSLALISDVLRENNIRNEITFFGSSKNTKDHLVINGKEIEFDNTLGLDFLKIKSFIKLIVLYKKLKTKNIFKLDYIFDIAEGDSFTDIYGKARFDKILNSKRIFNWLGKKQMLLPQTIGPFKNQHHEKKAFKIMNKIDTIISRDKQSYDYTAKTLPSQKIMESIDIAFYLPFSKSQFENNKTHVGINISGLLWNGGYTKNNQFNLKTNYKELIRETLTYFGNKKDVIVHLVPHVVPTDFPTEDDYTVAQQIKTEYPDVLVAPRFASPIDAKSYISGLDFFTGARMHACIAAFSSGVPVFPMAYSRKFNGLFVETLQYPYLGDCVNEKEDKILDDMIVAFKNREVMAAKINTSINTIIEPRLKQLKITIKDFVIG